MNKTIFLVILAVGCTGKKQTYTVPPLPEDELYIESETTLDVDIDYSTCTYVPRGRYASDLRCESFTLSEKMDVSADMEAVKQNTLASLLTQYPDLETEPAEMAIGGRTAMGKTFESAEGKLSGLYVLTEIPAQGIWSAACFGKGRVNISRCKKSILDTAEKGGIKRLGAEKKANPTLFGKEFDMGEDCWQPVDRKIVCGKNELSWTEAEPDPVGMEKEIIERFVKSAKAESLELKQTKTSCSVDGKTETCTRMVLSKDKESQSFVTVVTKKRLLVCSYQGHEELGRPCDQVVTFK